MPCRHHTSSCGNFVKNSPILPRILFDRSDMFCLYSSDSSRPKATCSTLFDPMQNLQDHACIMTSCDIPCQDLKAVFVLAMQSPAKHHVLHKRCRAAIVFIADLLVSRWSSLNCLKLSFLMFWYLNKYTTGYLHIVSG